MRNTSGNIASLSITLFLAAGTFPAPSRHLLGRSDHSLRTRFDPLLSRTPDRQATNRSGGRPHEFQDQEPCSPLALRPLLRLPWNSAQNSPGDEEAGEEDEGQEGGKPPFVPNRQPSEPPFPATRRTAPRCFEPSDRPSDAGTPAFPLGFPSPSPAAATPPESPSHHPPHPHPRPSAASVPAPSPSASPASPPAPPPTDGRRVHSQAPPRHSVGCRLHR
jgi:hypothetical protein